LTPKKYIFAPYHKTMKNIIEDIKQLSNKYLEDVISIRRAIHSNPELAFEEHKTAGLIASALNKYGIENEKGIAKTGVVALIKGKNPEKKTVALRADMDALPIRELNDVEYKSKNDGIMHACGHDVHTASLIGTAIILQKLRTEFEGSVKLIFQPSEEKYPGGAKVMIEEGVLKKPSPELIFGQHVYPDIEAGKIGMKSGKYMASTDEIFLTVKGKGGHGALPHKNIDPVIIASHIIIALQQIVSRNARPDMPTVLSFGRFVADGQTNVIPDKVEIAGIMRTFDENWRKKIKEKVTKMAKGIAESMGGECDVFIDQGYPVLVNDDSLTQKAKKYAIEYLGEENVIDLELRTTAEDFAYFTQQIPGCFYRLGVRNEKRGITSNLHTATFDVDEKSLETGMGLMAWLTVKSLL